MYKAGAPSGAITGVTLGSLHAKKESVSANVERRIRCGTIASEPEKTSRS